MQHKIQKYLVKPTKYIFIYPYVSIQPIKYLQSKAHNGNRTSSTFDMHIPPHNLKLIHCYFSAFKVLWFSASKDSNFGEVSALLILPASEPRLPMNVKSGKFSLGSEVFPLSMDFTKIDCFCSSVLWLLRSGCPLQENELLINFQLCKLWELMENPQAYSLAV